jgi:hypothetical protein
MKYQMWTAVVVGSLICGSSAFAMGRAQPSALSQSTKTISDSLVKDLKCSTLTRDTVLSSLQPDAFAASREIPIRNWPDELMIGHCWALSHAQRILYYLGRFQNTGSPGIVPFTSSSKDILDQFQGTLTVKSPAADDESSESPPPYEVFAAPDPSYYYDSSISQALEHYQIHRFANPLNVSFLAAGRDRDPDTNADTFATIQDDLAKGRAPLIVLRQSRMSQHVVMVKRVEPMTPDEEKFDYRITVYDSNFPGSENVIRYSSARHEFAAPEIFAIFGDDTTNPIGVFIVDEGDMDGIQDTLLTYYTNRCLAP